MGDYAAIVLAGGEARRMGGGPKPLLAVGGVPLLSRVLQAVEDAAPIVVVGPSELDGHLKGALRVQETPPGGGPVAGIAAGVALCGEQEIAVVAGDLPFLTIESLARLRGSSHDCTLYVDENAIRQSLVAVWKAPALRSALKAPSVNRSMRDLLKAVDVAEVSWNEDGPPPWYDCDTPEALKEAERWL